MNNDFSNPSQEGQDTHASIFAKNITQRLLVGVPAIVIALALAALAPVVLLAVLAAAAGCYGLLEFLRLTGSAHGTTEGLWIMLGAAALPALGAAAGGLPGMSLGLLGALLVVLAVVLFGRQAEALNGTGLLMLGMLLVPWSLAHIPLLAMLPQGRGLVALLVMCLTLSDTLAYAVGTLVGRRPLWPAVSPHKTVEGSAAGLVGGILGGLVSGLWLTGGALDLGEFSLALVGAAVALSGQMGDLLESRIKRLCNAGQSGNLLPGHGGLLDRIDAYMLSTPLLYYYIALSS